MQKHFTIVRILGLHFSPKLFALQTLKYRNERILLSELPFMSHQKCWNRLPLELSQIYGLWALFFTKWLVG